MRGTQESLFKYLLYIILAVALGLFCFRALMPIANAISNGSLTELITGQKPQNFTTLEISDKQNPFPLDWVEHVIGSGMDYQLSEVACEIAGKINDDFMANLYEKSRQFENGKNCERDWCIIQNGVGLFRLDTATNVNQPTNTVIPGARSLFAAKNCSICEEPQSVGGNLIADLDEVCINYNLNKKSNACLGPTIIQGKLVEFGNKDCGSTRNGDPWQSHCDSNTNNNFCSYDLIYEKILWNGDKTKYNEKLTVENNGNIIDWSPWVMWWKSNSIILNKSPNKYMYGILWDSSNNQRYEILFEQIPMTFITSDENDLNNIFTNITAADNFRVNRLGNWYSEAREIEHFVFTPTTDVSFQEFYNKFNNVVLETCNDRNDCSYTTPKKRDSAACNYVGFAYIDDKITIERNFAGNFKAGKNYEISVKNWVGYYFGRATVSNTACYDYFDRTISIYEESPSSPCDNDGICESGETSLNCPNDCPPSQLVGILKGDANGDCWVNQTDLDICNGYYTTHTYSSICDFAAPYGVIGLSDINTIVKSLGKLCSDYKPSGLVGDVTGDCYVDVSDALVCAQHFDENWPRCDLDSSGTVGLSDYIAVISISNDNTKNICPVSGLSGDVNGDCFVNIRDLNLCKVHEGSNWPRCDWDGNGVVGLSDYVTVTKNYGKAC
jgi:hypothetical protein